MQVYKHESEYRKQEQSFASDQTIPNSARCSFHSTGNCFVSIVSDNPLGSLPIRIDSTMSGERSVSRSSRAAKETSNPISRAKCATESNL